MKLSKPIVVDGVEQPAEFDDESELHRVVQLGFAANKRLAETARLKKEREAEQAALKDKARLRDLLKGAGHNPRQLAAEWLAEEHELATMTPEQRGQREAEQRAARAEGELNNLKTEAEQRAQQQADDAVWAEFEPKLIAAAEKSLLPNDEQTMDLLARVGMEFASNGVELSPEHVVAEVQRRQTARTMRYVPSAPVPMLAAALKPMPIERLMSVLEASGHLEPVRAALVARWKQKRAGPQTPTPPPTSSAAPNGHQQQPRDPELGRYITAGEFRKRRLGR